ncbi:MAG: extracellular solute-binding protein [Chloroflexi bacterium]|nr:extracellular solute-binding protein [Chloroflexota bacterium]
MTKKGLSRRDFLRLTATTAVGALLTNCAPAQTPAAESSTSAGATAPAAEAPPMEEITLRLWHWDNFLADPWLNEGKLFTEQHSNIKVVVEMTPYEEYSQKVNATIAGGTPPDVAGTVGEHFTNMAGKGQLIDLKPYIEKDKFDIGDWHPGNLSQNSWGGVLLAIPYSADGMWWFYQIEEFQKHGLKTPNEYWKEGKWNWDTVKELAAKLTSGEGAEKVYGCGAINYDFYFEILPYIASNGGDFFDQEYTKCIITDPKTAEVYQWAYDMRQYSPNPEDQRSGGAAPQSGRVMQWLDWSPSYQIYLDQMPFKYSVAPPPASPATGTQVFCGDAPAFGILKSVKNPDQSWAFIEFLMSPPALERVFLATNQEPPRLSMATDINLWKKNTKLPDPDLAYELTAARFKGFYNTPKTSNWLEMWQAHNEELSLAWADERTLAEGLDKAAERINQLLSEAQVDHDKLYWTT